jgi:hypothetical protein
MQAYADRGVFRGFLATPAARGRVEYRFMWLLRRPMHAVFDPRTGVLSFATLFPGVEGGSPMVVALKQIVAARSAKLQPAHKRIDARRAAVSSRLSKGHFSLAIAIRGKNHAYAVQHMLNLINELFLELHETYPDYLVDQFGLSTE